MYFLRVVSFSMLLLHCSCVLAQNAQPAQLGTLDIEIVRSKYTLADIETGLEIRDMLRHEQWGELEKLHANYLKTMRIDPDGHSELSNYYASLREPESSGSFDRHFNYLNMWRKANPDSVLAQVVYADSLTAYAWDARGKGLARSVTDEGWKKMKERLAEAREILEKVEKKGPPPPGWYSAMQTVALGQDWVNEECESLFNKATTAYPTYYTFYFKRLHNLLERWGGREGEWEAFAQRSADNAGAGGDALYARLIWCAHRQGDKEIKDSKIDFDRAKRGFDKLLVQFPDDLGIKSEVAWLAVLMGRKELARTIFNELGNHVAIGVWKSKREFFRQRKRAFTIANKGKSED